MFGGKDLGSSLTPSSAAGALLKKRIEPNICKSLDGRATQRLTSARLLQLSLGSVHPLRCGLERRSNAMGVNTALAGRGSNARDRPSTVPRMIYFYRIVSRALIRGASRE